jgi:hypothetical protein
MGYNSKNQMASALKCLAPVLVLWAAYLPGMAQVTDGAIISWNNDTLPVKIAYVDIVSLQRVLRVTSPNGIEVFHPGEIRGFILNRNENLRLIDFSIYPINAHSNVLLDEHNQAIPNSKDYQIRRGLPFGAAAEPGDANELPLFDSTDRQRKPMVFSSITIDNNFSFFAINATSPADSIQAYFYYYKVIPTQKFLSPQTALDIYTGRKTPDFQKMIYCNLVTFKNGRYVPYPVSAGMRKYRKWLSELVYDYPLLSGSVKHKEFPSTYFMVINAYNGWRRKPPATTTPAADTSAAALILAGVSDARKYYKPKKLFWPTFVGSSLIIFPGMIYGAAKLSSLDEHPEQIEVPNNNPPYTNNKNYQLGYRSAAETKSAKTMVRGVLLGFCVCVGTLLSIELNE